MHISKFLFSFFLAMPFTVKAGDGFVVSHAREEVSAFMTEKIGDRTCDETAITEPCFISFQTRFPETDKQTLALEMVATLIGPVNKDRQIMMIAPENIITSDIRDSFTETKRLFGESFNDFVEEHEKAHGRANELNLSDDFKEQDREALVESFCDIVSIYQLSSNSDEALHYRNLAVAARKAAGKTMGTPDKTELMNRIAETVSKFDFSQPLVIMDVISFLEKQQQK